MKKIFSKNVDARDKEPWEIGSESADNSWLFRGAIVALLAIVLAALIWHVGGILMGQDQEPESMANADTAESVRDDACNPAEAPAQNAGICDPSLDPAYQGNAPVAGGMNQSDDGTGEQQNYIPNRRSDCEGVSFVVGNANASQDEVRVVIDYVDTDDNHLSMSYEATYHVGDIVVMKAPRVLGYTAIDTARCDEPDCNAEHWLVIYEKQES